ncbi:hypothetical protein [Saccharomonospora cyanea]|uniref:hypothetical protein n=1 Tax=Saccharomonospora cyanea TaxID=40989 RepID=UPI0012FC4E82|nr:hypothetical protein [Saccharomonospora cyanea]
MNAPTTALGTMVDADGVRHAVVAYNHETGDAVVEHTVCGRSFPATDEPHDGPVVDCLGCGR